MAYAELLLHTHTYTHRHILITFHWLIETMLGHVTVVFSYVTAVVLNLKTQSGNIYSGFKG